MSDLYKATQGDFGSFSSPYPGGSSSKGFYQQPLNIPYYQGRSILATIPEYQRNPLMLEKDLLFKYMEGRQNFMKIILEYAEMSGGVTVNDVRYRMPVDMKPVPRVYLSVQGTTGAVTAAGYHTFKIKSNQDKIATAKDGGNPKQVGDIARLEKDQFIMLMFSWVEPRRTGILSYAPGAIAAKPVPEICKVISVDYAKSTITVQRNWAGEQRDSYTYNGTNVPAFQVTADGDWTGSPIAVPEKYAFILPMAKSMKEDEIDAKIKNYSNTWVHGIMQRHLLAWGSQYFSETISQNLGIESPLMRSRQHAIEEYYDHWEWQLLFGEKSEFFDAETGYWYGTTDGLLTNIPKSHYVAIKGIDYNSGFTSGSSSNMGSFHPLIFNKILESMAYMGSQNKVLVCGSAYYTAFTSMINFMTQQVPDIKSEWRVEGKTFRSSNGLTIDVVPSDKMSLNGLQQSAILYDKTAFKMTSLKNYPGADIVEVQNENPLKKNGFIHGVKGSIDMNPDSHWVFTVIEPSYMDGTSNTSAYDAVPLLGTYLG